jgi:hypothetical protein
MIIKRQQIGQHNLHVVKQTERKSVANNLRFFFSLQEQIEQKSLKLPMVQGFILFIQS